MRIAVSSDMDEPVARRLVDELVRRGHAVLAFGALSSDDRQEEKRGAELAGRAVAWGSPRPETAGGWAWSAAAAARSVAEGEADQAVVCCWTGTGASIAANKLPGVRAALCADAYTAQGARRWNDANTLALSLRTLSGPVLEEILDAWFEGEPSQAADDRENVAHLRALERAAAECARDGEKGAGQ